MQLLQDAFINPVTAFFAGIFAEAVLLLWSRWERGDLWKILGCIAVTPLGMLPGKREDDYNLLLHLLAAATAFCVTYAILFRKKLLLTINKELLLLWNAVFLYVYFTFWGGWGFAPLTWVVLVMSSAVLLVALTARDRGVFMEACLYAWFLIMIVVVAALQFGVASLGFFLGLEGGMQVAAWQMFFVGAAFLFLVVNIWYIIELLPWQHKGEKDYRRLRERMDDLAHAYDAQPVHHTQLLAVVSCAAVLLAANYHTHSVSDVYLVPLVLVASQFIGRRTNPLAVPPIRGTV